MRVKNTIDLDKAKASLLGAGNAYARMLAETLAVYTETEAPVDTGAMKASVTVVNADGESGNLTANLEATVGVKTSSGPVAYRVQVLEHYAAFVELGHYTVSGRWIPPNPFMRRALARLGPAARGIASRITLKGYAGATEIGDQAQHPTGNQQRDFQIDIDTAIPSAAEPPVG